MKLHQLTESSDSSAFEWTMLSFEDKLDVTDGHTTQSDSPDSFIIYWVGEQAAKTVFGTRRNRDHLSNLTAVLDFHGKINEFSDDLDAGRVEKIGFSVTSNGGSIIQDWHNEIKAKGYKVLAESREEQYTYIIVYEVSGKK